jgi:hypothetical protein
MVGVATDVDALKADLDGLSETVGLAVVGHGEGIFG